MPFRSSRVIYFLSIVMLIGTSLHARAQTGLAIETPSCRFQPCPLPSGTNGVLYSDYFLASGGVPPYTWEAETGNFSDCGLSVTTDDVGGNYEGHLSGTASTGTCSGRIVVADSTTPHPLRASVLVTLTISLSGGAYTLTYQQPYGVANYSGYEYSVTAQPLPADIMNHCYGNQPCSPANGDNIAKCTMLDCVDTTFSHSNLYPETAALPLKAYVGA